MLIAIVPVVVAVVGLLMYALCKDVKLAEIGRLAFSCGLLVSLFVVARTTLRIP